MNTINQTLFTARVTDGVPPRLSVEFAPGSNLKNYGTYCDRVDPLPGNQIRIHLADESWFEEAPGNLASPLPCGTHLEFKKVNDNTYTRKSGCSGETKISNLSQVILQVRNASLVAQFTQGTAVPMVPMMPGSTAPAPAPVPVQPAVAVAPIPAAPVHERLKGCLPESEFGLPSLEREKITVWQDYQRYVNDPNRPVDDRARSYYDIQYPLFLQKEKKYLALQEKLTAIAAHNRLMFIIPEGQISNFVPYRDYGLSYDLYRGRESMVPPTDTYQKLLQAERDYLTQQARNEYNSAS